MKKLFLKLKQKFNLFLSTVKLAAKNKTDLICLIACGVLSFIELVGANLKVSTLIVSLYAAYLIYRKNTPKV